ncbi:major facilitator superfamily protein [Chaetomium tenue]|uniref:Major facilitator superfamily protein n=1 Tax=Chaetomium tenue TaxID=1854479 RepID=A0ACB7P4S0_9PEZI|nr:major facilitator superfamily protein [Chaetomium globosum]
MTSQHKQQDGSSETQPLLAPAPGANEHTTDNRSPWHDAPVPNGSFGTLGGDDHMGIKADVNVSSARARLKFIFPALAIGIFLAAGDQTIIVSSYGRIGSDLDELDKTAWLATAYLCTTTAFQPLYGKLGDIFGRKACLLFAYSVFGLGALFCGLAGTMTHLIVARALTGIGAGGIITVASILLSDIVTLEERGIWQGYVNMVFACGAGLGAPLGGILTDAIGWRWAFIGQGPLCAIAILLVAVLLQLPPPAGTTSSTKPTSTKTKLAQVDFLGATTLITSLTTLLLYLDLLASTPRWTTHLYLLASALLLLAFLYTEHTLTAHPLTPLHLLFGRPFLGAYLALAFGNVAWYGVLFYVPLLYQATAGHFSASAAGALLLPGIASGVVGGFVGGAVLRRRRGKGFRALALAAYPLVGMACVGVAVGAGVMFWAGSGGGEEGLLSVAGVVWGMSGSLLVGGLGNGAGMTATLVAVVAVATPEDQAVVTACVYLYRQLGATVGLAVISLVFRRVLAAALVRLLGGGADVDEVVRHVLESLDYLQRLPAETRVVVEQAYGEACRAALLLCAGLAVCAIVCSCFIKEQRQSGRGVMLPVPIVE